MTRETSLVPVDTTPIQRDLPPPASVVNPIDVIGDARSDRYRIALAAALADPNVDAALILFTPQAGSEPEETARVIAELSANQPKPVATSYMGAASLGPALKLLSASTSTPTACARCSRACVRPAGSSLARSRRVR